MAELLGFLSAALPIALAVVIKKRYVVWAAKELAKNGLRGDKARRFCLDLRKRMPGEGWKQYGVKKQRK